MATNATIFNNWSPLAYSAVAVKPQKPVIAPVNCIVFGGFGITGGSTTPTPGSVFAQVVVVNGQPVALPH